VVTVGDYLLRWYSDIGGATVVSTFGGEDLFNSGPHRFHVGGVVLRHVQHEMPGGLGVKVIGLGLEGREIIQTGDLIADDTEQMRTILSAIEARVNGQSYALMDDLEQIWPNTAMLYFKPEPTIQAGTRFKTAYTINYLQITISGPD
jgi:hypothetical protein